jgi:hypothetical protein
MLSGLMPIEWMLAVLRDPKAEQSRRDEMAKQCAPFLHPRLAAVEVGRSHRGGAGAVSSDVNLVQIYCIPRGARLSADGVVVDGTAVELASVEPFTPTPSLLLDAAPAAPERASEPLPVIEPEADDPEKVTALSAWRRRDKPDE